MAKLYQVIGVIDSNGAMRAQPIFKEDNGELSQMYPGHFYKFQALFHKRWRWWVEKGKLDRSALMDWEPDVEELDLIERTVARVIKSWGMPTIPRFALEGEYPNWKKVSDGNNVASPARHGIVARCRRPRTASRCVKTIW